MPCRSGEICRSLSDRRTANSTINHSSTAKEIEHALKIVKPKLMLVDVAVLDKVRRLLRSLDSSPKIMTMIERVSGHLLVGFRWIQPWSDVAHPWAVSCVELTSPLRLVPRRLAHRLETHRTSRLCP